MSASVGTRLALLEEQVAGLRRRVSQTPEQEVAWRMHNVEREMRIQADVDAARAKETLAEALRTMEDIMAEAEGLVWFLRGKPSDIRPT